MNTNYKTLSIADAVGKYNNLTVLRLVAAIMVIYGHSFAMVFDAPPDPFKILMQRATYSGDIAVNFFFVISGFLVAGSLERHSRIEFAAARILRIFPALIVCNVVMILYVAFAFHSDSVLSFLKSDEVMRFFSKNSLLTGYPEYDLPGAFPDNKRHHLNGTYWTLPAEVRCYLFLFLLGLIGIKFSAARPAYSKAVSSALVIVLIIATEISFRSIPIISLAKTFDRLFVFFLMGVVFYQFRKHVPVTTEAAALALVALIVSRSSPVLFQYISYIAQPILVFYLAYGVKYVAALNEKGDFSYGVYIYGWLAQQIVASFNPNQSPYENFALATILALAFAVPSWFLIEKPALSVKAPVFRKNIKPAYAAAARPN